MTYLDQMSFTTLRIRYADGERVNFGTGFFLSNGFLSKDKRKINTLYLVTCKHVIENNKNAQIFVLLKCVDDQGESVNFPFFVTPQWFFHPTEDLCMANFSGIPGYLRLKNHLYFAGIPFSKNTIMEAKDLAGLETNEEVSLIGYPVGIIDDVNNFPLIRKGTTAYKPAIDFQGEQGKYAKLKVGVVDMPVSRGSSGSPIIITNSESLYRAYGLRPEKPTVSLLGIAFETSYDFSQVFDEKTKENLGNYSVRDYVDIGYYIKSEELLEMIQDAESIFFK